jgi:hypothetical protein
MISRFDTLLQEFIQLFSAPHNMSQVLFNGECRMRSSLDVRTSEASGKCLIAVHVISGRRMSLDQKYTRKRRANDVRPSTGGPRGIM